MTIVGRQMATAYFLTATLFVLFVTPGKVETTMFTKPTDQKTMYTEWTHEDFLDDCLNEESANEYVKSMESTPMENSYVSIIETALDALLA